MVRTRSPEKTRRKAKTVSSLPDLRANERLFADLHAAMREQDFSSIEEAEEFFHTIIAGGGRPPRASKVTPLERAQDIMYNAWDASGEERIRLALKALALSKDCADAYVLLAGEVADEDELAMRLLEDGVKAGERALGEQTFREEAGNFWMILETRPYMRARFGLALLLHSRGERRRAIGHFQDLLRLNPNDNQGARYELATCLLEEGDDDALERLLSRYDKDGSAVWLYSRALLKFRQEGESQSAGASLMEAFGQNRYVPQYLLGKKRMPSRLPEYMSRGDRTEAVVYAHDNLNVWKDTPGALPWLDMTYRTFENSKAKGRRMR